MEVFKSLTLGLKFLQLSVDELQVWLAEVYFSQAVLA
jgi:hypothetical protein